MSNRIFMRRIQSKRGRKRGYGGLVTGNRLVARGLLVGLFLLGSVVATAETATLVGQTRLPQLPDAEVTVRIGNKSSAHVADETGGFAAEVTFTPGSDLVRIEACGVGDQAGICHLRLIHASAEVDSRAGADAVYETGDLSPVSTAAWALLVNSRPDMSVPTQLAEVEDFILGFASLETLGNATVLSLLARGFAPLPTGAEDLVDVALDRALLTEASNSLEHNDLAQERQALIQNDNLMRVPDAGFSIAGPQYFVLRRPGKNSAGEAHRIDLNEDGTGSYAQILGSGSVEWRNVDAGELIFADGMEAVGTGTHYVSITAPARDSIIPPRTFFFFPPGENATAEGETRLTEVQWRELDASDMLRLGVLREIENAVAPNRPDLDPEQIDSLGRKIDDTVLLARADTTSVPLSPVPSPGTTWAFARCDPDCKSDTALPSGANLDLIGFNADGTATSEIVDPGLNWQQSGSRTSIEQDNGISVDVLPFGSTARHIGDLDTTLTIVGATRSDGQTFMTSHLALEANPAFEFTEGMIPGRYESMNPLPGVIELDSKGTGWFASLDDPTAPRPDTGGFDIEWSIDPAGDLLLAIKQRDQDFTVGWWALRPVRNSADGFYAVERLAFEAEPIIDSGGTLVFLRRVE